MSAKLERLLNLIAALLDTSVPLSAEQIRARIEGYPAVGASFRRAFERDKDDLREMGIPIRVEEIPGSDPPLTGYRIIRRDYEGHLPELTPDELAALHVASNLVRVQGLDANDALRKLGGIAPNDDDGVAPLAALPSDPRLAPLFRAATERALVTFRYHGSEREVEPYRVSFTRGQWYLGGFDRSRGGDRLFRVDRIDGAVAVGPGGAFDRPETIRSDPRVRAWELGDVDPIAAHIEVDADQAVWAVHATGRDAVVEHREDGSVLLELQVRNVPAFRGFVLSFLEHAEVLEPSELRDDIVQWLRHLAGEVPGVSRFTATERLTRLLAVIPHVAGRGFVAIDDVAARFNYPRAELVADLTDVLPYVGVAPFTPDALVEVVIDEDHVRIDYADWFSRPLRLSPEEALALFAAGRTVVATAPDEEDAGPLVRGLTKLGAALGDGEPVLEVHLGAVAEETLAVLRRAVAEHRQVRLDYYSFGRDQRTERIVEPHRFYADEGNWYVAGYCHLATADRVFRVDRIREATLLDETFADPGVEPVVGGFAPAADDPRVVLDLESDARWVIDHYPHDDVLDLGDGRARVTLGVSAPAWLERLLVRLGDEATVVSAPDGAVDVRRSAAQRILARYTADGTASPTGRDPEPHA